MKLNRRQFQATAIATLGFSLNPLSAQETPQKTPPAKAEPKGGIERVAWMAGGWESQMGSGKTAFFVDETWSRPRGGRLLGMSQIYRKELSVHQEFLQIKQSKSGELILEMRHGLSDKADHYRYQSKSVTDTKVVFENDDYEKGKAFRLEYRYEAKPSPRMIVEVSHRGAADAEGKRKIKSSRFVLKQRS